MKNGLQSICPFCAMGCVMQLRRSADAPYVGEGESAELDYDPSGSVNRGSLCGKGNMALELLTHPERRIEPRVRVDGELAPASWTDALDQIVERVERVRRTHGPTAVGILAGPHLSNEEAVLATKLARAIGTPHLDLCQPEDGVVLTGLLRSPVSPTRIESVDEIDVMRGILVVGDLFTQAPCMAKPVLNSRYDRHGNVLGTISSWHSRTAAFGKPRLECLPGRESAALTLFLHLVLDALEPDAKLPSWAPDARQMLAGFSVPGLEELSGLSIADLQWPLDKMLREEQTGVLLACGFGETERADLVAGLCGLIADATGSRFLVMPAGPNSVGVRRTLDAEGAPGTRGFTATEMVEASATGELKALISLSVDPVGSSPGRVAEEAATELELLVTTGAFASETDHWAHVTLPTAAWGEKVGTAENAFGDQESLSAVMAPPGSARPDGEILTALRERFEALGQAHSEHRPNDEAAEHGGHEEDFFGELELHLRMERREEDGVEFGSHLLFPEHVASHSGDGWLTRPLSWPQHEMPHPSVAISPRHASALGVRQGDMVRVRSRDARADLVVRIERRLRDDIVLAPPHYPEVRRLTSWRVDPALRDLDIRPGRVSVEALQEATR